MKKNILIGILILAVAFLVANLFQNWFTLNDSEKFEKETKTVQKSGKSIDETNHAKIWINDSDGTTNASKEIKKSQSLQNAVSKETQKYIDKEFLKPLKAAEKNLIEFDKVKAVLSGEIPAANIQIAENKSVRIEYKNKYLSVVTETDKDGKVLPAKYTYDAEIARARIVSDKSLFFWQKEKITDTWKSPDENFRINGVEHYSQEVEIPRNIFQLQAEIGAQFGFKNPVNSHFKTGLKASFNQDGFLNPEISYGKIWNMKDGTIDNYGGVGINMNILKIKR